MGSRGREVGDQLEVFKLRPCLMHLMTDTVTPDDVHHFPPGSPIASIFLSYLNFHGQNGPSHRRMICIAVRVESSVECRERLVISHLLQQHAHARSGQIGRSSERKDSPSRLLRRCEGARARRWGAIPGLRRGLMTQRGGSFRTNARRAVRGSRPATDICRPGLIGEMSD